MSNELTIKNSPAALVVEGDYFSRDQIDLIKRTIAKGASDDELKLFEYQCRRTGLDPFSRQIYAIMRSQKDKETGRYIEKMTIQTGIDGFRLIADRTGRYVPGDNTYEYNETKLLVRATATVKKRTVDGMWHEVRATAMWDEYVQCDSSGKVTKMWAEKPHVMLGKCAEALALRKAFPAELSGLYTDDEIQAPMVDAHPEIVKARATSAARAAAVEASISGPKDAAPSAVNILPKNAASSIQTPDGGSVSTATAPDPKADVPGVAAPIEVIAVATAGDVTPPSVQSGPTLPTASADSASEKVECFKKITEGKIFKGWQSTGFEPRRTLEQNKACHVLFAKIGYSEEDRRKRMSDTWNKDSSADLSVREMSALIKRMETRLRDHGTEYEKEAKMRIAEAEIRGEPMDDASGATIGSLAEPDDVNAVMKLLREKVPGTSQEQIERRAQYIENVIGHRPDAPSMMTASECSMVWVELNN